MVALAENARIPVDNPATHLELTMVHEAMVLEYSGRHLALIEAAAMLKLLFYMSLIACIFVPWGLAAPEEGIGAASIGLTVWAGKLLLGAMALAVFETSIAKMRVFRVSEFLAGALLLGVLAVIFLYVSRGL
jgi:formate hydrogenlyase subunit 4